ncbi:5-formyltetrahydrofolate cyclo-ligase [Sphaerochaeta sp. PS]|uniref:5-formyltetrahydrofolate cyclo-ligase n=1 Tax=Sphaerochaeta sp. PS TaxID=3076336 RepID=UPI0028A39093|nr:5-formyltetrahydrofolate cyclo-ligase [Sphaerochaeta sp. PS]MDT4761341.1 5-formyltetrahydrofolate cyclo-ligase [Sphaerochaeta sp. PS]
MESKQQLRAKLKQLAKEIPPNRFVVEDMQSVEALLHSPLYMGCTTLFAFSPLPSEVDITPILRDALQHKRLALPRCIQQPDGTDGLQFHLVQGGWEEGLEPSRLGIMEPTGGEIATIDEHSLILVPAMAYTPSGERLGRGKGFYDRYLQQFPSIATIGICRGYQMVQSIPTESWDRKVKQVLCAGLFYRT